MRPKRYSDIIWIKKAAKDIKSAYSLVVENLGLGDTDIPEDTRTVYESALKDLGNLSALVEKLAENWWVEEFDK